MLQTVIAMFPMIVTNNISNYNRYHKKLLQISQIVIAIIEDKFYNKYSKTCVKQPLSKRPKIGFQDQL